MAELRQYPTDQELKDFLDAASKGKQALGEFLDAQQAKREAEKAELAKRDVFEGNCMTQDMKNDEDQWPGPPYIVYRNPEDDKIRLALEEAERRLKAARKPLVLESTENLG